MPAVCMVLNSYKLEHSITSIVRLLKSFRRGRCLADAAGRANLPGTFRIPGHTVISHLTLQQQKTLRCKTHSHNFRPNKCRDADCPPHGSRFLMTYPEVKRHLFADAEVVVINVCISRSCVMRHGIPALCNFDDVRCAMEYIQTIVNVLHAVEEQKVTKNTRCLFY